MSVRLTTDAGAIICALAKEGMEFSDAGVEQLCSNEPWFGTPNGKHATIAKRVIRLCGRQGALELARADGFYLRPEEQERDSEGLIR